MSENLDPHLRFFQKLYILDLLEVYLLLTLYLLQRGVNVTVKKFDKILLFASSLICLFFLICILSFFYPIPFIADTLPEYIQLYPWLQTVFAVFIAVLCLFFLLLLLLSLLSPIKLKAVTLKKEKGRLQFSNQTIESAIRYSYADLDEINFSKITIKLHRKPEKIKIYVKLSLKDPSQLVRLTTIIQEKIELTMKTSFGLTIQSVNVSVAEVESNEKTRNAEENVTRVV